MPAIPWALSRPPVFNVSGVSKLNLSGMLAGIYMGTITTWNDPAIKKLNPALLAKRDDAVFWRSDAPATRSSSSRSLPTRTRPTRRSRALARPHIDYKTGTGEKSNSVSRRPCKHARFDRLRLDVLRPRCGLDAGRRERAEVHPPYPQDMTDRRTWFPRRS